MDALGRGRLALALLALLVGPHTLGIIVAVQPAAITLSPSSGPVDTEVTIKGSGFTPRGNVASFGKGYIRDLESADGATIRFRVPEGLDLCSPDAAGPCPGAFPPVIPGEYVVSVKSGNRTSGTATFTVTR